MKKNVQIIYKRSIFNLTISLIFLSLISVTPALAHVVVKPGQAGIASFQTFSVGVPVEKDSPTIGLRLVIPAGLAYVIPNVKPGWTITVKKTGEGEDAKVTEINWTGGNIPSGQRDEFVFSVQVPAEETTLQWKAYQTYEDGTVVSWDQKPSKEEKDDDFANIGPYSETVITNDLKPTVQPGNASNNGNSRDTIFSLVAIALSLSAIAMQMGRSRK
jgi:uncharacterized protein YcnI